MEDKFYHERKNDLIVRAEEILNLAKKENRALSDDEVKEVNNIRAEVDKLVLMSQTEEQIRDLNLKKSNAHADTEVKTRTMSGKYTVSESDYRGFENFVRGFVVNHRDDPVTPTNMDKGSNGAIIPTTVVDWIIKKVYDISPVIDLAQKYNVKGKLEIPFYPSDSDDITAGWAEEFTDLISSAGKIGNVELTGYLAGALCKISRSLINNTAFDIVSFVVDVMAINMSRFIENVLLNGAEGKATGLSTLTNSVTTASANAITADEIVKLKDRVKDVFQQDAVWIMSRETRTALRLLKSQTGYYLLNDDISSPFGTTLLGKPVYVSDNMPEIGAGNTVIYYGDMKGLAVKFSEEIDIQVLYEHFATQHAVGVVGWVEFDSKVIDEQQIAKLVCHS